MILFWTSIVLLLGIAIGFVMYPLRMQLNQRKTLYFISALSGILIVASLGLYDYLGNAQGVKNAQLFQQFNLAAERGRIDPEYFLALTQGLKAQLAHHPDDPMTWALLGKIYLTLSDYSAAEQAFAKAHELLPDDPDILIDYASASYLANDGQVNAQLQELLEKLNPPPL